VYVVLSLGGSLIYGEKGLDRKFLESIKQIIEESDHSFGVVTGGGKKARDYAEEVRKKGGSEFDADVAAIRATKENAKELINVLGSLAYEKVADDFNEAREGAKKSKVVVMGGTIPGITTDTDAVLLAEALHAKRLVNISNVDAIYDSDPRKNPMAKRFKRLNYEQLVKLAIESDTRRAGEHFIFDILACKLISRSKIEAHFVSGKRLEDVKAAIEGMPHSGTVVSD
jgi:uridylate kinase